MSYTNRTGCPFFLSFKPFDNFSTSLVLPAGAYLSEKKQKYFNFSQEKAHRLYADYLRDFEIAKRILSGQEESGKSRNFLLKNKADYVYYDKTSFGERVFYPDLLRNIFQNNEIVIYQVNKN